MCFNNNNNNNNNKSLVIHIICALLGFNLCHFRWYNSVRSNAISNQIKMENLINDLDLSESAGVLLNTPFFYFFFFTIYKKRQA